MLKLGPKVEKQSGLWGRIVFSIFAETDYELDRFFIIHKDAFNRGQLDEDELLAKCLTLPEEKYSIAETLVRRHNMELRGLAQENEKKEFLDHAGFEAVKGIIYGTDFFPKNMTIDLYVGAIMKARDEYGDSVMFEARIIEMAGPLNSIQMEAVAHQIKMFGSLFNVPFEEFLPPIAIIDNGEMIEND